MVSTLFDEADECRRQNQEAGAAQIETLMRQVQPQTADDPAKS